LLSVLGRFTLELSMLKFVILGVASLAFVGTAVAADLPRAQPVVPAAPAAFGVEADINGRVGRPDQSRLTRNGRGRVSQLLEAVC
jgi:hypothetical protein